jgi:hypothetical protein
LQCSECYANVLTYEGSPEGAGSSRDGPVYESKQESKRERESTRKREKKRERGRERERGGERGEGGEGEERPSPSAVT